MGDPAVMEGEVWEDSLTLLQRLAAMKVVDKEVVELGELCKGWDRANSPYYLRRQ